MLVEGYDKCPTCGRPLKDRVLVKLVDEKSREVDYICFSEESWNWIQNTSKKFGLDEGQTIKLFSDLYLESVRLLMIGKKYHLYYQELIKMLGLFHG